MNKSAYVYTTGTVGTVVRSWAYGYDDPNWKDKLTSFDGHTITYDAIGNPLNDGEWTYEWQAGRQLKRMTNLTTGVVMEFTYNHAGIRTKKVKKENGVAVETTEYILNGKQVVGLIHTDHSTNTTDELQFFYDAQGRVSMFKYEEALYNYVHNLQGDIIGVVSESGEFEIEYKYDAWGAEYRNDYSIISQINPFKYRGYCWDEDSKLYYLWDRYYACSLSRFINIDRLTTNCNINAEESNTFAYCSNNPVVSIDPNGTKKYSAQAAIEYAEKWSHDRNPDYFANQSDCANFVSQCLYEGGLQMNIHWFYISAFGMKKISKSWGKADGLFDYLSGHKGYNYTIVHNEEELDRAIHLGEVQIGDPAFFKDRDGDIHHAVLIGEMRNCDVYFYAHSNNRSPSKNALGFKTVLRTEDIYIVHLVDE